MLRLFGTSNVYYNDKFLCYVRDMDYIVEDGFGSFIIHNPDNTTDFIPEQDCTATELMVFLAYHEFYRATGGIKPPPVVEPGEPVLSDFEKLQNTVSDLKATVVELNATQQDLIELLLEKGVI